MYSVQIQTLDGSLKMEQLSLKDKMRRSLERRKGKEYTRPSTKEVDYMSTPPTTPTPTTAPPRRGARIRAGFTSALTKTTVYRDHTPRGYVIAVILGAAAVLVTGGVLWAQAMGTKNTSSNDFMAQSVTTLAWSVLLQAAVLFVLNRVKPTWPQVVAVLLLAAFMKFALSYVFALFTGLARGLWSYAVLGGSIALLSLILLYMLVFRLTAPKADSPELVKAKEEYDAAVATREAHQKAVDDLVEPVKKAEDGKKKADDTVTEATKNLKTLTSDRANKKIRKDHEVFVAKDTTVSTATTAAEKAAEDLSAAKTALEKATKTHKDAEKRQAELPGMIAGREAELVIAQSELATATVTATEKADLVTANPSDKAAGINYRRCLDVQEAKEKVVASLEVVLAKLRTEELSSDNDTRTALGQKRAAEGAVATNEKLEKAATEAITKAETALTKGSVSGKKLTKLNKQVAAQQKALDKANEAAKTAKSLNKEMKTKSGQASEVLAVSQAEEQKLKKVHDDLNDTNKESLKSHLLKTALLLLAVAGSSVAIWGYRLTQFAG